MQPFFQQHDWSIIEEGFHAEHNLLSEQCFSTGNGHICLRGSFEEQYTGLTLPSNRIAGVFYKIKNPCGTADAPSGNYLAEPVKGLNFIGIDVHIDGEVLDLATCKVKEFSRVLNMKEGYLERTFSVRLVSGKELRVKSKRFCSLVEPELCAIRYAIKCVNFEGVINLVPYLDGNAFIGRHHTTGEKIWQETAKGAKRRSGYILAKITDGASVCTAMQVSIFKNKQELDFTSTQTMAENFVSCSVDVKCKPNDEVVLYKYVGVLSSLQHEPAQLVEAGKTLVKKARKKGFSQLLREQADAWALWWEKADVTIQGDLAAQQGIRFSLFHLLQTFNTCTAHPFSASQAAVEPPTGDGIRWEWELFFLPFLLATSTLTTPPMLLSYRHQHLTKAIDTAEKLGLTAGAALFPLLSVGGEECNPRWDTPLLAIHRNGAIAYAIHEYVRYTGDFAYLADKGLEVLIALCRFWAQRVHWSEPRQQYVLHGVIGPNEYENNVNNNWYTNYLASWCFRFTLQAISRLSTISPDALDALRQNTSLTEAESDRWAAIAGNMFYPMDANTGIILQQEDYLEKQQLTVLDLNPAERPLHLHWSPDSIWRSCFVQQADVLLGLYLFETDFDRETLQRNFDFYEHRTVHESPFSICIHTILAARLGLHEKAFEPLRTSLHLSFNAPGSTPCGELNLGNMAGNWLSIVRGFAGMKVDDEILSFQPFLPTAWEGYSIRAGWRGSLLVLHINREGTTISNLSDLPVTVSIFGQQVTIEAHSDKIF